MRHICDVFCFYSQLVLKTNFVLLPENNLILLICKKQLLVINDHRDNDADVQHNNVL